MRIFTIMIFLLCFFRNMPLSAEDENLHPAIVAEAAQKEEVVTDAHEDTSEPAPEECDCGQCYEKCCKWEKKYYKDWECEKKEECYESKHCRYIPQYYEKTMCRYVPQYYTETYVKYVPQYYSTYETFVVPKYKQVTRCKYVPKYFFKKKDCPGGCCNKNAE